MIEKNYAALRTWNARKASFRKVHSSIMLRVAAQSLQFGELLLKPSASTGIRNGTAGLK